MTVAGLDIGSRTIALVEICDGERREALVVDTGPVPEARALQLLGDRTYHRLVVTGYGRHLPLAGRETHTISEIKAHALGARALFPGCLSVIDVGGQDVKAILLDESGNVVRFEMNDRCAAGTGRFLENMARLLECPIEEFGSLALSAHSPVRLNTLCTVFAESEVVSALARGRPAASVALGLHQAVAERIASLARRVGCKPPTVFCGGGGLNACLIALMRRALTSQLLVPPQPQGVGALGAALHALSLASL